VCRAPRPDCGGELVVKKSKRGKAFLWLLPVSKIERFIGINLSAKLSNVALHFSSRRLPRNRVPFATVREKSVGTIRMVITAGVGKTKKSA